MTNTETTFDLVAHTKRAARDALDTLTGPDEDILPVIVSYGPRGVSIFGAVMPSTEEGRDQLAENITARIAVAQATEAAMVCVAYISTMNVATGEISERQENIVLIHCTLDQQKAWTAKVTRHPNRPPDMSIWEELGEGMLMGRFASAMVDGLSFATTVDTEMQQILDEGYREGRVDELALLFLKALHQLGKDQA